MTHKCIDYEEASRKRLEGLEKNGGAVYGNLTVRDYFAAKAMQALIEKFDEAPFELVDEAYDWADAMMQERNK